MLQEVLNFQTASRAFSSCRAMLRSDGQLTPEEQAISNAYFEQRFTLTQRALDLRSLSVHTPLQAAVYRWGVWQQAASHTAQLKRSSFCGKLG